MKKILFTTFCICLIVLQPKASQAQLFPYVEVVYLSNGSMIRGMIIEEVPNKSYKIQTADGSLFVVKAEEVLKITREPVTGAQEKKQPSDFSEKEKGYYNISELNFAIGVENGNSDFSVGVQTVNGYRLSPRFQMGIGAGADIYKYSAFIPVFADFRYTFLRQKVSPVLIATAGYAIAATSNYEGGFTMNPGFGVRIAVSSQAALHFNLGYRMVNFIFRYEVPQYYSSSTQSIKRTADFLNIKMGVSF